MVHCTVLNEQRLLNLRKISNSIFTMGKLVTSMKQSYRVTIIDRRKSLNALRSLRFPLLGTKRIVVTLVAIVRVIAFGSDDAGDGAGDDADDGCC